MSDLPKSIQVIFENNPQLKELIPNPTLVSDSSFVSAFSQKLGRSSVVEEGECFYKVVFKKNSSRELMTINSGELKGLLTSTCIEKGKISDVAGLEKVELDNQSDLMPTLLGISLYGSIQNNLSYISHLCVDIRNHQIIEEQARFERISETIVDSFKSIPDIALDRSMRDVYLSRIVKNNDDCYEMYISQRQGFNDLIESEPREYSTGFRYYYTMHNGQRFYPDQFFESKVLAHPVFSVFERLVAGRICEIVLSGNYSDSNIQRHKDFISRVQTELEKIMEYRLNAFHRFTEDQKRKIEEDLSLSGYDRKELNDQLVEHIGFVDRIENKVSGLLEAKLDGFNILAHLMEQDEIDVFLIDGKLLVSNTELSPNKLLKSDS
ncbi:hypothetical protein OC523_006790 [Vibrio vulnificus]|uniref:hypothetical protein n=2 Tax=Vibrionaceae TaxID=641 RepID=UPI000C83437D|nr:MULTISPECIES: hypothetical protein [Vibrio]MCU8461512.1 hypothetical protein [Vibrio vulnificus]PMK82509.1 hypothetical protein BCT92_13145 [Vibrio sp. 10N.261.52.E5]PTQ13942.1 hypothetical protein CWO33_15800 [Vibrio splendidus]TKF83993.1 hypothetical protein FCV65_07510 [Vibrio sp. F13]